MRIVAKGRDSILGGGMLVVGVAAVLAGSTPWFGRALGRATADAASNKAQVRGMAARLPLTFEENRGQSDPSVRFLARGNGATMWLADDAAVFAFAGADSSSDVVRMRFLGASGNTLVGAGDTPTKSNYFTGTATVRGAKHFAEALEKDLWPGVDLRWYGSRAKAEYDLTLAPGTDPSAVRIAVDGAEDLRVTEKGDLAIRVGGRDVLQGAPVAYQMIDGAKTPVAASFTIADGVVGVSLGAHDASRAVVVDPTIYFSTFFGGSGDETGRGVAYDSVDVSYVICGGTNSPDLPLGFGHLPTAPRGSWDAYVMKLSADASYVKFATYVGGRDYDEAWDVAVDAFEPPNPYPNQHRIWVTGQTFSSDFPTVNPYQAARGGGWDAFLTEIEGDGSAMIYSTYFGGVGDDFARGMAIDDVGRVFVTGYSNSSGTFPLTGLAYSGSGYNGGANDAFLFKVIADHSTFPFSGVTLLRSAFLGGNGDDRGYDVALRRNTNEVFVTGYTTSTNFPRYNNSVPSGATVQNAFGGSSDAFVTHFSAGWVGADPRVWSTTIGGTAFEAGQSIDVDDDGTVAITGRTESFDLPRVGSYQITRKGPDDAFLASIVPTGDSANFITYFGGAGTEIGNAVAFRRTGPTPHDIYVFGTTTSADLPVSAENLQGSLTGGMNADCFLARFGTLVNGFGIPVPGRLKFCTYIGGNDYDYGNNMVWGQGVVSPSSVFLVGTTRSPNFPIADVFAPVSQPTLSGPTDAFVMQVDAGTSLFPAGDVTVEPRSPDTVAVSWKSDTSSATDVIIRRVDDQGVATDVATVAPTTNTYVDTGLSPDTSYGYSVVAVNGDGSKDTSPVVSTATLPYPPAAPSGLVATAQGSRVLLDWTDASTNESSFVVQRSSGGDFVTVATLDAGVTHFAATTLVSAATDSTWRVLAQNRGGVSASSNQAVVTTSPTLQLAVKSGSLVDAAAIGADRFTASGRFAGAAFDPTTQAVRIEFGSAVSPVGLSIPAGDRGWKVKLGVATWSSARSHVGGAKFQLTVDVKKGAFDVAVSAFDFPSAAANPVHLGIALGDAAGAAETSWTEKAAGRLVLK